MKLNSIPFLCSHLLPIAIMILQIPGAHGGSEVKNGDYCQPQGQKCERVNFRISARHPQQEYLLELLQQKQLPTALYNEVVFDLLNTPIIYSDELLKYKDLRGRFERQYPGGSGLSTGVGYFIHAYGPGYDAGPLDTLMVRAVTQSDPAQVTYFTKLLNSGDTEEMRRTEQLRLTLHEQAHRLKIFGNRRFDERFAEGWAQTFSAYLQGSLSQNEFFVVLRNFGVPTVIGEFSDVRHSGAGAANYISTIPIVLRQQVILKTLENKDCTYIELHKSAFAQYSALSNSNWIVCLKDLHGEYARAFMATLKESSLTVKAEVHIERSTNVTPNSMGSSDRVLRIEVTSNQIDEKYWSLVQVGSLKEASRVVPPFASLNKSPWQIAYELGFGPNASVHFEAYKRFFQALSDEVRALRDEYPYTYSVLGFGKASWSYSSWPGDRYQFIVDLQNLDSHEVYFQLNVENGVTRNFVLKSHPNAPIESMVHQTMIQISQYHSIHEQNNREQRAIAAAKALGVVIYFNSWRPKSEKQLNRFLDSLKSSRVWTSKVGCILSKLGGKNRLLFEVEPIVGKGTKTMIAYGDWNEFRIQVEIEDEENINIGEEIDWVAKNVFNPEMAKGATYFASSTALKMPRKYTKYKRKDNWVAELSDFEPFYGQLFSTKDLREALEACQNL